MLGEKADTSLSPLRNDPGVACQSVVVTAHSVMPFWDGLREAEKAQRSEIF